MHRVNPAGRLVLMAACLLLLGRALSAAEQYNPPVGEAVKWLLEHNRDYQKALADREKARMNVVEAASVALPSLEAKATGTHLGNVQSFEFDTLSLKTAAEKNYSLSLALTQLIFSGSAFQAIGVSRSYERVSESILAVTRAGLLKDFLAGYARMGLLERLRDLNAEMVTQTRARFDDSRLLKEMGALSNYDLLRSEVEYMNSVPALREAENLHQQAASALALQLNLPAGTLISTHDFELASPALEALHPGLLSGDQPVPAIDEAELARLTDFAQAHRPESEMSQYTVDGYRRAVGVYRSGHLPTLAAFANLERANQWDMFSGTDVWRNSWNAGLQLSLPLFTGFRTTSQVVKGRQDLRKAQADDSVLKDAIRLELRTALDEVQRRSLDSQAWARNAEAAAEGLAIATTRRENGAGSELELRDARTAMKAARVYQAQARFDLLKARIDLLHALGLLDQAQYTDKQNTSEE